MKHRANPKFWQFYAALPENIQRLADQNYKLLNRDPRHPSLHFKKVDKYWSARVGIHYRAVAIEDGQDIVWFWIGITANMINLCVAGEFSKRVRCAHAEQGWHFHPADYIMYSIYIGVSHGPAQHHLAPECQDNLLMRLRGIASKSEAVRLAVREAVERETTKKPKTDWRASIGWANQFPENPNPRFKSHDELWEKDK